MSSVILLALTRFFANTHLVSNRLNYLSRRKCFQSQVIIACICQPVALDSQKKLNERLYFTYIVQSSHISSSHEKNLNTRNLSWNDQLTQSYEFGISSYNLYFFLQGSVTQKCDSNRLIPVSKYLLPVCDKTQKLK